MSHVKYRSLMTTALFLVATGAASSQDIADEERRLEPVETRGQVLYSDQINALKTPTPIIDVPQSLSIISAEDIAVRGFDSIGDIITYTPGVNTSQGEGHRDAVVFRGVRSTADFFIDGARDDVQYYRPLYNLEQVEILRGPNALLFGRGGTGGILNRVTKRADIDEDFTGYQASVDTFGGFGASVDYNTATGEQSAFRLNAMYENLQNHRDFYDGERFGINPALGFEFGDSTRLDLSYEYVDHERFIDRGIPTGTDGEPVEAFTDFVFGDASLNTTTLQAHIMRANLQHQFADNLKGNFSAFFGDYDKLYQNFYASAYNEALSPTEVGIDGYLDTTQRKNATLSGNLIGEFATGGINHTLIIGAEYANSENNNDRFNPVWSDSNDDVEFFEVGNPLSFVNGAGIAFNGNPTSLEFSDLNDQTEANVDVFSIYFQDEIEINRYVDLILGGRFDSFEIDVDIFDDTGASVNRSRTDEEFSPRAGLIIKPQENISLYASYSESFLPRSGGQFVSIDDTTELLDPDVYEQAEIGVKWDVVGQLSLTAAYFQNDETRADRDPATEENFEVRGLEVEGFEVQLQGNVTGQLYITAGYSYLDGETDNGAEIPRELPENTFSVWGNYEVTEKFGFGLGAIYQDESFITDLDIVADASTHPTLPAYTRFDASAYFDVSDNLRLQVNIENLTDETYFPSSHSTHQATVGAPLNARFAITGRF